jgi:hypothetical protein
MLFLFHSQLNRSIRRIEEEATRIFMRGKNLKFNVLKSEGNTNSGMIYYYKSKLNQYVYEAKVRSRQTLDLTQSVKRINL